MEIEFAEELSSFELIQKIVYYYNEELIFDDYFVEISKVRTHALSAFFFSTMKTSYE